MFYMAIDIGQTKSSCQENPKFPSAILEVILYFGICRLNLLHLGAIAFEVSYNTSHCRFSKVANPVVNDRPYFND